MLSVVCWKWSRPGYRSTFDGASVNVLRSMVRRHYAQPHRFICITDDPAGIAADVEIVPAWNDFADVASPHGGNNPSCYRRLRMFAPDVGETLGDRIVSLDLDTVILRDVAPLWDRDDEFMAWRDPLYPGQCNGSMMMVRAGARPFVWDRFDPKISPAQARRADYRGSDQAWISYCLPQSPKWGADDGAYSFRLHCRTELPANARIVFFHGRPDPWQEEPSRLPWVRDAYRLD